MRNVDTADKEELEAMFGDLGAALDRLRVTAACVLGISEPLEHQPGGESRVYRARTKGGSQVIRVDFAQVLKDRAVAILLQDYFSRFGAAPRITGLLEGEELRRLREAHPAFSAMASPWPEMPAAPAFSAILMEEVEDGWNILQPERSAGRPPHLANWKREAILAEARRTGELADRLGVQIIDPQFLVGRSGEVRIVDFDHWIFLDSANRYWGYDGLHARKLKEWPEPDQVSNDFSRPVAEALTALGLP